MELKRIRLIKNEDKNKFLIVELSQETNKLLLFPNLVNETFNIRSA